MKSGNHDWRMMVYEIEGGGSEEPPAPSPTRVYRNAWRDNTEDPVFSDVPCTVGVSTCRINNGGMTVDWAESDARRRGATRFDIQAGFILYLSNQTVDYQRHGACTGALIKCRGNPTQTCGYAGVNEVWDLQ